MNRRKFGSSVGGKISKSSVRRVACALAKFQGTRTGGLTREREKKKKPWIWFKRQKPGAKERADKKISDKKQSRALDGENVDHTDTK